MYAQDHTSLICCSTDPTDRGFSKINKKKKFLTFHMENVMTLHSEYILIIGIRCVFVVRIIKILIFN